MPDLTWIVALIPAFPLLGFLLNALFIRRERAAGLLACVMVALSFICTLIAIYVLQGLPVSAAPEGAPAPRRGSTSCCGSGSASAPSVCRSACRSTS